MFSKTATIKSISSCWDNIKKGKKLIENADAVVIGARENGTAENADEQKGAPMTNSDIS